MTGISGEFLPQIRRRADTTNLLKMFSLGKTTGVKYMKKGRSNPKRFSLGELIFALFEEAKNVTSQPAEQKVMVYMALKDLLSRRVRSRKPIALQI
ncbi:MAG: hypothetical protein C5B54_09360 [Acidobacteria bacterium]|nr:MAG: hypothetical protein C5B54_09360 [Acidobacteriota bacterium]